MLLGRGRSGDQRPIRPYFEPASVIRIDEESSLLTHYLRYSSRVVAPIILNFPLANNGFNKFAASIPPPSP